MTVSEALDTLRQHHVPCAPIVHNYVTGFFDDPSGGVQSHGDRAGPPYVLGPLKLSGNLVSFDGSTTLPTRPTPLLGEHTREVLEELGYTPDEISELYELGVVKTEAPA